MFRGLKKKLRREENMSESNLSDYNVTLADNDEMYTDENNSETKDSETPRSEVERSASILLTEIYGKTPPRTRSGKVPSSKNNSNL